MDKFRAQSLRFGTKIITETISKVDLSARPFRYWREFQEDQEPETADTLIIATGASAKRLGLKGEDTYWQSGISAKFGIQYVNYTTLERVYKRSAIALSEFWDVHKA